MEDYKDSLRVIIKNGPYAWSTLAKEIGISKNTMRKVLFDDDAVIGFAIIRKIKAFIALHTNLLE